MEHIRLGADVSRRAVLAGGLSAATLAFLAACSPGGGGGSGSGSKTITYASWGDPGQVDRLKAFNADYTKATGQKVEHQLVTGDYVTKLRTQIVGGKAPDAYWLDDSLMGQSIQSKFSVNLTEAAKKYGIDIPFDDYYPSLARACVAPDGSWYGLPIDANPMAFWFNKDLLQQAGVTVDPAQLQEAGTWDQNALTGMLDSLRAADIRGLVYESSWFSILTWASTFGGKLFDDEGKAVFQDDPKALAAFEWLFDQTASGNALYAGSLPQGQGVDALFYGGQLATIQYGRWILPSVEQLTFSYDIAPLPSATGAEISSVAILVGFMGVSAKSSAIEQSVAFTKAMNDQTGAAFRLSDAGVAVPALSGIDDVVTEGGVPAHASWFNDIAAQAFHPTFLRDYPDRNVNFPTTVDSLLRSGVGYKEFAQKLAAFINGES